MAMTLLIGQAAMAQVPNAGFENWSGTEANSWVSTNGLTLLGNSQSIFKSADARSGSSACEINTIHVANKPPGRPIPDYTASIFIGRSVNFVPAMGAPYTYSPNKFVFWYKYIPKGTDTAIALVTLTRWNTTTNKRDTIGLGASPIPDSTSIYTKREVAINYFDNKMPDTLIILFTSSAVSANQTGSKLIIDDMDLVGGNIGIAAQTENELEIYPNPAKNVVNIGLGKFIENVHISVCDMQGKNVYSRTYSGGNLSIQTNAFVPGVYVVKAVCENTIFTRKIIVE